MIEAPRQTPEGTRLAMWAFVLSEFMLFGALFILYAGTRAENAFAFHSASLGLHRVLGTVMALLLLTSSLLVSLAISDVRAGGRRKALGCMALGIVLAAVFLGLKGWEWGGDITRGVYPGGPELMRRSHGEMLFYGLYFVMTGFHGIHLLAGMCLMAVAFELVRRGRVNQERHVLLDNAGLYWHMVDIVWLFLLPLLYLAA